MSSGADLERRLLLHNPILSPIICLHSFLTKVLISFSYALSFTLSFFLFLSSHLENISGKTYKEAFLFPPYSGMSGDYLRTSVGSWLFYFVLPSKGVDLHTFKEGKVNWRRNTRLAPVGQPRALYSSQWPANPWDTSALQTGACSFRLAGRRAKW